MTYTINWHLNSSDHLVCHADNNLTYLVNERRCVKNQELFSGKHVEVWILEPN